MTVCLQEVFSQFVLVSQWKNNSASKNCLQPFPCKEPFLINAPILNTIFKVHSNKLCYENKNSYGTLKKDGKKHGNRKVGLIVMKRKSVTMIFDRQMMMITHTSLKHHNKTLKIHDTNKQINYYKL